MKLSVLITFYNQEKYVDATLESVFSQECDWDFEVLVGEDGSTDHTVDKLHEWQEKYPGRIQIFSMDREPGKKYNGSIRASRNRLNLLPHVKGEYFTYLDGDDFYVDKKKFQKQIEILDAPENAGYVACAHNVYELDEATGESKPFLPYANRVMKLTGKAYWGRCYFHPDSILFRSKYIEKLPMEQLRDYYNDNIITYCFLKYGGIYYMPDLMASYRQTGDGIWTGNSKYIGYMRNLMDLDLEKQLAPEFGVYSLIRHRADIRYFVHCKEEQDAGKVDFYRSLMERDQLTSAKNWVDYSRKKRKMSAQMFGQYAKASICYVLYHIKWLVVDTWLKRN